MKFIKKLLKNFKFKFKYDIDACFKVHNDEITHLINTSHEITVNLENFITRFHEKLAYLEKSISDLKRDIELQKIENGTHNKTPATFRNHSDCKTGHTKYQKK
ncbi:MAG: hypothetical protein ACOCXG_05955 [Nanoarchaeota archaeon]